MPRLPDKFCVALEASLFILLAAYWCSGSPFRTKHVYLYIFYFCGGQKCFSALFCNLPTMSSLIMGNVYTQILSSSALLLGSSEGDSQKKNLQTIISCKSAREIYAKVGKTLCCWYRLGSNDLIPTVLDFIQEDVRKIFFFKLFPPKVLATMTFWKLYQKIVLDFLWVRNFTCFKKEVNLDGKSIMG